MSPAAIEAVVHRWVRASGARKSARPDAPPPAASRIALLRATLGRGDGAQFRKLVEAFLGDTAVRLGELRQCLSRKDAAMVRRLAHTVRGSCLNLGALRMTEVASALERVSAQRGWGGGLIGRPARDGVPTGRIRARHPPQAGSDVMKILMVEDDPAARMALGELLEHAGHEVVTATGGDAAWAALRRDYFPLMLLDRVMPELDGIELCRRIRARRQTRYPYVILVTMVGGKEPYLEGMNAGADDYFQQTLRS